MMRKRLRSLAKVAVSTSLAVSMSGCGFILTQAPPSNHQQLDYFSCTESNAGPIIDIIWGGLNVLGALVVAGDPDSYANPDAAIVGGLAWGALSGTAAGVGFGKTRRCREARQLLAQRVSPGTALPPSEASPSAAAAVQAVVVSPAMNTLSVGERLQLIATAHNSAGGAVADRVFAWSSSNDAIASVGPAGLVTANAPGTVVIAARTGSVVGTATVRIVVP